MAAAHSHPFFPPVTSADAVEWAEAAWHAQPVLVRHYLDTTAAELHDALLGRNFNVRVVLPPVIHLNGELVQLPVKAPSPLIGGLWANLRQEPVGEDVLEALTTLQQHPHPAVAEAGMLLAYRVAYQLAFKDVPPSPQIIAAHEPFGDDGRLWGSLTAAAARVDELAHWLDCLTLAGQVFPALHEDVYFQRSYDATADKHAAQSAYLLAAHA